MLKTWDFTGRVKKTWIVAFYAMLLPACFSLTKPMDRPDAGEIISDTVTGPVMNTAVETGTTSATSVEVSTNIFTSDTDTITESTTTDDDSDSVTNFYTDTKSATDTRHSTKNVDDDSDLETGTDTGNMNATGTKNSTETATVGHTDASTDTDTITVPMSTAVDTDRANNFTDMGSDVEMETISFLEIISVSPEDSVEVSTSERMVVTFSEQIVESTVTRESFVVTMGDTPISGVVSVFGTTVIYEPDQNLALATTYNVKISDNIESINGNTLAASMSWSFKTVDGVWSTPVSVDNGSGDALSPQINMDEAGNAIAVWSQSDGTIYSIWSNRFSPALGWGTPEQIESNDVGSAQNPQIAADRAGNAIAVWDQSNSSVTNIWANRFTLMDGWDEPVLLEEDDSGNAREPRIAMNTDGNAVVVWGQVGSNYMLRSIYANRFIPGIGWSQAMSVEGSGGFSSDQQVITDLNGNAMVVWKSDGALWGNWFVPGTGWGTEIVLDPLGGGVGEKPQAAVNAIGNVVVVWTNGHIVSSDFEMGIGWGESVVIDPDGIEDAQVPQIDATPQGFSVLVWQQSDGNHPSIWTSIRESGGSWSSATLLEQDDKGPAENPQVAVGPGGNAFATWTQHDGVADRAWVNRFVRDADWKTATQVAETSGSTSHHYPQVAVDPLGNAIVIWQQDANGQSSIWASYFSED